MAPGAGQSPRGRETARAAARCIGAQYVASLDAAAAGLLTDTPKVGTSMLFARSENGRISLVRTGHVTRFERHVEEDPFVESERESVVSTSAPPLSPSLVPTPRRQSMLPGPDPYNDDERVDDRTKPVQALRQSHMNLVSGCRGSAEGGTRDIRALRPTQNGPQSESPPTMRMPLRRSDVAPRPGVVAPPKPAIRRRG
jgi:hypothetical protein